MKNKCSQVQREILASNGIFRQAVDEHCAECESCRNLKQDWYLFGNITPEQEIPLSNDFAVRRAAQKLAAGRKREVIVRRILGYTAAAASGFAALYTIIFGQMPNTANEVYRKAWNWDSFEEKVFILDTATAVSRQDIAIGSARNKTLNEFIEAEINF